MGLTVKQEQFCREYIIDLNATQAAIRAGYSEKTAMEQGYQLLQKTSVSEYVQSLMDKRSEKTEINAAYVLNTIQETIERCKQTYPVLDRKGEPVMCELPNGSLAPAYTFDASGVLKGAELLGKHLKIFTEKHEITGKDGGAIETRALPATDSWIAGMFGAGTETSPKKPSTH